MKIKYNLQLNQAFEAKMQNQQFSKQNMHMLLEHYSQNLLQGKMMRKKIFSSHF